MSVRAVVKTIQDIMRKDVGVDGEDDLWQLCLADALVERGAQLRELGIFLLGGERGQMELVVDAQLARARGVGDAGDRKLGLFDDRLQKPASVGR